MKRVRAFFDQLHTFFLPSEKNTYRPASLARPMLVGLVGLALLIQSGVLVGAILANSPSFLAAVLESAIISLTNGEREALDRPSLSKDLLLTRAAQAKAEDMALRGYFSHVGPDGKEPWAWIADGGYDYAYAGENLAAHFEDSSEVVHAWMDSPTHRDNLLKPVYRDIGVGVAKGVYEGKETTFVVQFFGVTKSTARGGTSVAAVPEVSTPTPAPVVEPVPEVPTVAGESTQVPGSIARLVASPYTTGMTLLGAMSALIILALILTVIIRIQFQPVDLLLNGAVVLMFFLSMLAVNTYFLGGADIGEKALSAASVALE